MRGLVWTGPGSPASAWSSPSITMGTPLTIVACTPWGFEVQRGAPFGKSWASDFWSGPTVSGSKIMMSAALPTRRSPRSVKPQRAAGMAVIWRTPSSRVNPPHSRTQCLRNQVWASAPSSRSRWAPPSEVPTIMCGSSCAIFVPSIHSGVSVFQTNSTARSSDAAMSRKASVGCTPRSAAMSVRERPMSFSFSGVLALLTWSTFHAGGGRVGPAAGSRFGRSTESRTASRKAGSVMSANRSSTVDASVNSRLSWSAPS